MNLRNALAIAKKNLQIIARDRRTVGLLLFMPIFIMLVFGYGFGQDVKHVPIKVVNLDEGGSGVTGFGGAVIVNDTQFSDQLIDEMIDDERIDITLLDNSNFNLTEEKAKIYGPDNYYALVVIPENFSEDFIDPDKKIYISVYLYGSETMVTSSLFVGLGESLANFLKNVTGQGDHVVLDYNYVAGSEDMRPLDSMAPGMLSFAILLFMILTVTGGFTKERLEGTMHRSLATTASKGDIILGYFIGNSLIAMIQVTLLLLIAVLLFNITITGNVFLVYLILFLYAINSVGMSIFLSSFARTQLQAFQFIPLIVVPSIFFSGFIYPILAFPKAFQYMSYLIPMTFSVRISRAVMLDNVGFKYYMQDLLWLIGYTILFIILAVIALHKRKD